MPEPGTHTRHGLAVEPITPLCHEPDGTARTGPPLPAAILSGSFNPLHQGHTRLASVAAARLGIPVAFELSVTNVDKPELTSDEVTRRARQFLGVGPIWITRAPTFAQKAELFPGAAFVLGYDTAVRLIDPRYYGHDLARRDACLRGLLDHGCRVVVAGRVDHEQVFRVWSSDVLPRQFRGMFLALTEADFRVDVSSTALRQG